MSIIPNCDLVQLNSEVISLHDPNCISNKGTRPINKEIIHFPAIVDDKNNNDVRWPGERGAVGIFQAYSNRAQDSENLTGAAWTKAACDTELSDEYYDGKRFTKVWNTGATAGYVYQSLVDTWTTLTPSFSIIVRKGRSSGNTTLLFAHNDKITPIPIVNLTINWDNYPNAPGTPVSGILHNYDWKDFKTLEIRMICDTLILLTDDIQIFCYGSNNTIADEYTYWTAVLAVDLPYPTPYTPTSRVAGKLDLSIALVNKFTLMFWVRPWFTYDTATYHRFCEWHIDITHRFLIYYNPIGDRITVFWVDGGTTRSLTAQLLDDSGTNDINQWIMVAAAIDLSAQGQTASRLKVYTEAGSIGEDTDWGVAPDAFTGPFPIMSIGQVDSADQADSLICDILYVPNEVWSEARLDAHYNKSRPWCVLPEVSKIEYALTDIDNNIILNLNDDTVLQPAKGSLTFENEKFAFENKIVESSSLHGAVKLGKTRIASREITLNFSQALGPNVSNFRFAENSLLNALYKTVYLIDEINEMRIPIAIMNYDLNYDKGAHKASSNNEISIRLLKPFWEKITPINQTKSLIIDLNEIEINNLGSVEVPPIITLTTAIPIVQLQIYIDETKEGIQIDDALFGELGYFTMIINCKEGTVTIGSLDRVNSVLAGTGFFKFPIGESTLVIIPTGACDISIDWYERFYL